MVPDAGDSGAATSPDQSSADGRHDPGFDEVAMYRVVRKAMEDAILGAVGTLLLVGVAFVLVLTGASIAVQGGRGPSIAIGVVVALFGLYLAGSTLELIPPIREWW